jgi:hypothetical protein
MADRSHARIHRVHAGVGLEGGEHVLPHRVARTGVVEAHRAAGVARLEAGHEVERLLPDVLLGPACCHRGVERERVDVELAQHHEIVVPHQADVTRLARERDALVRLGAVAHQIAEAPGLVHLGGGHVLEDGAKCWEIGVNV